MLSMSVQSGIKGSFTCPSFSSQKPSSYSVKHQAFCRHSSTIFVLKSRPIRRIDSLCASATAEAVVTETTTDNSPSATRQVSDPTNQEAELDIDFAEAESGGEANGEAEASVEVYMDGEEHRSGLDQKIPGHGTIPLSPYYIWPRKDAWEELKTTLESKPWISQKKMIILLNQATDIINLWQQSGGNLSG